MHKLDIHNLADEAELNSFHYKLIGWVILILVLDGYDIAITGAALPAIMADLKIDSTQAGFLASASLVGMMFGTVLFGILADKFGRRWTMVTAVALFSLLTAAAGFTRDPIVFAILRFLAGLGLGGILPILIALGTEYMPVKVRARLVALTSCGYAVGGVLAAILGKGLIDTYGWQGVFIAAGAPVVLIPFILKYIPESLPLLVKQNRDAELRETVRKIAPDYPLQAQEQFLVPHEDEVGAVSGGWLFDKLHPKWVLFSFYVLSAVSLVVMGYGAAPRLLFVIVCAVGAFTLGTQILTIRWHVLSNGDPLHCPRLQLRVWAGRRNHRAGPDRLAGRTEPGPAAKLRGDRRSRRDRRDRGRAYQPQRLRVDASHRYGGGEGGGGARQRRRKIGPRVTVRCSRAARWRHRGRCDCDPEVGGCSPASRLELAEARGETR